MNIAFPFKEEESPILGKIRRPIAEVQFQSLKNNIWQSIEMIVDSGADYTLLPRFLSQQLEVDLNKETNRIKTKGIGGIQSVFLLRRKMKVKLGLFERWIMVGFANDDFLPPLLGRHTFFETFKVIFEKFTTTFS